MPQIIEYMDKIARQKQRDILILDFSYPQESIHSMMFPDYENFKPRTDILEWLKANNISWQPCCFQGAMGYNGIIYVDVPYDVSDTVYQKLASHLETPGGVMKLEGIRFICISLEDSMKYAEQDDPAYWEKLEKENPW